MTFPQSESVQPKGNHSSVTEGSMTNMDWREREDDEATRHCRLSIEVLTVSALKRASNFVVQFAYPHLDSAAPVRSHPIWVTANADKFIDGACVTYEFCRKRCDLRRIFLSHQFKVCAFSRSPSGHDVIGDTFVDLSQLFDGAPHSFRSPVDKSSVFKRRQDYDSFRDTVQVLRAAGRSITVPPKDPVIIRALDAFYPLLSPTAPGAKKQAFMIEGKIRVKVVLEELSLVSPELAFPVHPGYTMANGAVFNQQYKLDPSSSSSSSLMGERGVGHIPIINSPDLSTAPTGMSTSVPMPSREENHFLHLQALWEEWKIVTEAKWRETLREKEIAMRRQLEMELNNRLLDRSDDLRKAQDDVTKLETRLKNSLEAVDKQQIRVTAHEEQITLRLAQKTAELQLLERKVRADAKIRCEMEVRRAEELERQLVDMKDTIAMMTRRNKDTERDFDSYRQLIRSSSEKQLREEVATLKAQLADGLMVVEREKRISSEVELEKEHHRGQMNRLAIALKKERERSSIVVRQDLEQLRLDFLAREERYVLDGDRDELKAIREELSTLRNGNRKS